MNRIQLGAVHQIYQTWTNHRIALMSATDQVRQIHTGEITPLPPTVTVSLLTSMRMKLNSLEILHQSEREISRGLKHGVKLVTIPQHQGVGADSSLSFVSPRTKMTLYH